MNLQKLVRNNQQLFRQAKDNCSLSQNLRNRDRIVSSFTRLQIDSAGAHHMCVNIYNKLPEHIKKKIETDTLFLKKLKDFLVTNCFYDINEYYYFNESI